MEPKDFAPVLNWKKNRKTNVSKTVQQLGPEARNSNWSNQICSLKGSQMFSTFLSTFISRFASLQDADSTYTRPRWAWTEPSSNEFNMWVCSYCKASTDTMDGLKIDEHLSEWILNIAALETQSDYVTQPVRQWLEGDKKKSTSMFTRSWDSFNILMGYLGANTWPPPYWAQMSDTIP